jgi:hypothetical protein
LINCGFDSLKTFVNEIIANKEVEVIDKVKEVCMMLISLVNININLGFDISKFSSSTAS